MRKFNEKQLLEFLESMLDISEATNLPPEEVLRAVKAALDVGILVLVDVTDEHGEHKLVLKLVEKEEKSA